MRKSNRVVLVIAVTLLLLCVAVTAGLALELATQPPPLFWPVGS